MRNTPDAKAKWPELAEGLYGFLTGRGATIDYSFDEMEGSPPRTEGCSRGQLASTYSFDPQAWPKACHYSEHRAA